MRASPHAAFASREHLAGADPGLLYRQIAASIRSEIGTARLSPGARLPSIMSLAGQFGVAPATVRQALGRLSTLLSGAQVGITLTTILLGYTAQVALADMLTRALGSAAMFNP